MMTVEEDCFGLNNDSCAAGVTEQVEALQIVIQFVPVHQASLNLSALT